MRKATLMAISGAVLSGLMGGYEAAWAAQQSPPLPMAAASRDPAAAPAGEYHLDPDHAAVISRVSHRGISYSVLRFGVRSGSLHWDAARPADIKLDVTVNAKPIYTPVVYKILPEGPQSLNVAQYPEARFISSTVRPTGEGRAVIEGRLTLMGVTRPAQIDAALVGVGRSMEGMPTIGFTGSMTVDTAQFTQSAMAKMVGKVTVVLDAEFVK